MGKYIFKIKNHIVRLRQNHGSVIGRSIFFDHPERIPKYFHVWVYSSVRKSNLAGNSLHLTVFKNINSQMKFHNKLLIAFCLLCLLVLPLVIGQDTAEGGNDKFFGI